MEISVLTTFFVVALRPTEKYPENNFDSKDYCIFWSWTESSLLNYRLTQLSLDLVSRQNQQK